MSQYDPDYLRIVGHQLWRSLSAAFGQKITKTNFRAVIRRQALNTPLGFKPAQPLATSASVLEVRTAELPEGPVRLGSPLYIARPPIEERCYTEIHKPGALIRIRAPRRMGKTSLKNRIAYYATSQQFRVVKLNFAQVEAEVLRDLNRFLRWFCANISLQLNFSTDLDRYWDPDCGLKVSCTAFMQSQILNQLQHPLLLLLDDIDKLFEYQDIAQNLLSLLRSWYEEARDVDCWQLLRLIVVHELDVSFPLSTHQSPFNVGLAIRLPEFTMAQIEELAQRYSLTALASSQLERLLTMFGGHPYLIRCALYELASKRTPFDQVLQEAPTLAGIYKSHLLYYWQIMQQQPVLWAAMQQIVLAAEPIRLEPLIASQLESLGLVTLLNNAAVVNCDLYQIFFRDLLQNA